MDEEALPQFRYHPDPVATGMIGPSKGPCAVCGRDRGVAYTSSPYGEHAVEEGRICPWCIASGAAARELGASFVDDYPLVEAGLPGEIVAEVCERTPGYISWQQELWLVHCEDACEFHGDATAADVAGASPETRAGWDELNPEGPSWDEVLGGFRPADQQHRRLQVHLSPLPAGAVPLGHDLAAFAGRFPGEACQRLDAD